jgi:signal transduction histidine kinase
VTRRITRRREAKLLLAAAVFIVVGLLAVFAAELANTQARSKRDVEARVHERAVLAAALIDSLFQSVEQQVPQNAASYGAAHVSTSQLDRKRQQSPYLVLLDAQEHVLAASTGFTAQARADLGQSAALAEIRNHHPYGLGNVLPYGRTGVINFAVSFPTRYGIRTLLTGLIPSQLSSFITGELRRIPGVRGAHNYLIDGNNTIVASNDPARPAGYRLTRPAQAQALSRASGEIRGHYYDQVRLANSPLRVLLAAPDGPLFASVTGLRKWVPWLIFAAFGAFAALALALGARVLRSADQVREANGRLKLLNEELASTNEALATRARELARSNSELEQFASIASHDLQEPLRKVRTFTQQLAATEADKVSEKGVDYLNRVNAAAERMQRLIEDLLKFSRVATHGRPFASVDLSQITQEVLEDLEAQVESAGAVIRVGDLPTIEADTLQMRQLMQNLVSNAIKFRRPGVTPQIAIEATLHDELVELTVSDNGIGFEPQYSHRIFRVFERLHGRGEYPGTGIGLALCRKIAERHGGTVIAEGEAGAGARFTVTLPLRTPHGPLLEPTDNVTVSEGEEVHVHA